MGGMTDAQQVLARLDAPTADEVRPMVDHLVGVEPDQVPLTSVTQLDVQHFLWHDLPTKWMTDTYAHHELAWALGDFFEAAGLDRYATICRAESTHTIISAWDRDPDEAHRLAAEAQRTSGVIPPDTDTLTFGAVMGGEEARLRAEVSRLLERAIVDGRLGSSARGFAPTAGRLVEEFLRTPSEEYDGDAPAAVVRRERAAIWAHQIGPAELWERLLPELEAEPVVPPNVEASLAPATALLEELAGGVTLTKSGYLPPALALDLDARFGWSDEYGRARPRGEADLPPLRFLGRHLREQRLVTLRGNRLSVSMKGRRALADRGRLWQATSDPRPRWRVGLEVDAIAVLAGLLLEQDGRTGEELEQRMAQILSRKWCPVEGGDLGDAVAWIRWEWFRLGISLGWWQSRTRRLDTSWTLSPYGRAAAASAFWAVAAAPMKR